MKVRTREHAGRARGGGGCQLLAIAQERELQDAVARAAAALATGRQLAIDGERRVPCQRATTTGRSEECARGACTRSNSDSDDDNNNNNNSDKKEDRDRFGESAVSKGEIRDFDEHSREPCRQEQAEDARGEQGVGENIPRAPSQTTRACGQQQGQDERHHVKLAPRHDVKLATSAGALEREQAAHAGAGSGESDKNKKVESEASTRKETTQRRGFLEALLGDRGKSWLEQRTLILDIDNGSKRKAERRRSKNNAPEVAEDRQLENSEGTFGKLEKSDDNEEQSAEAAREEDSGLVGGSKHRLPTFGSVPQRVLSRLPYFSYQQLGRSSKHLNLESSGDGDAEPREHPRESAQGRYKLLLSDRRKVGSIASLDSRASSQGRSHGSPTDSTPSASPSQLEGGPPRRASQLGYSNISNLFPGEPASARVPKQRAQLIINGEEQQPQHQAQLRESTRNKSASLLDLQEQRQRGQTNRRSGPQRVALSERRKSHFSSLSPMTRRNSFSSLQQQLQQQQQQAQTQPRQVYGTRPHSSLGAARAAPQFGSQQSLANQQQRGQQQRAQMGTLRRQQQLASGAQPGAAASGKFASRGRPMSAAGSYLGGAQHQRSPSASSLHRNSYRLGSAGMSPLVDPDCPVHGESPEMPLPGGRRRNAGPDYPQGGSSFGQHQPNYSMSQPDLLYGNGGGAGRSGGAAYHREQDLYDPYNVKPPAPQYPIYDSAYQHLSRGGVEAAAPAKAAPPEYSPVSPTNQRYASYNAPPGKPLGSGQGGAAASQGPAPPVNGGQQAPAYYDGSSRFSLYHPAAAMSEGGGGGVQGSGPTRMSLAPPGEQLRRIIGYKPASVPRPVHLHPQWAYSRPFIHLKPAGSGFGRSPTPPHDAFDPDGDLDQFMDGGGGGYDSDTPKFAPFNRLQDNQAVRAVDFHPSGEVYAIGSNSRALRICAYPAEHELRHFDPFDPQGGASGGGGQSPQGVQQPKPPRVLFKFLQVHRGSIYCVSFNPSGQLLATGSNDQTVHIVKYNSITHNPDGEEFRLTMHNGTIRDLCFIDDSSGNGSSLLLSAGGGDNKIYVTDCDTITPFQSMAGHTQMVMALSHCGGAQFVSGSYDKTIRFWDLRSRSCTSIVSAPPSSPAVALASERGHAHLPSGPGAPVCALRVDPSGRLLASGHTDSTCMLYDIRGAKIIQTFKPHDDEIRAISFSPKSYYLLTGGYDGRLVVSDLQGDLTQPLPSACVAESQDKIVQAKWHPADFTFVSTSADKSATLWSLPGEIRN